MATGEDHQKDAPHREAREEEGTVKEKSADKTGHEGRPGGQLGAHGEGPELEDHLVQRNQAGVDQPSALFEKQLEEALQCGGKGRRKRTAIPPARSSRGFVRN